MRCRRLAQSSRSVFGDDGPGPVEVIVETDADDLLAEGCRGAENNRKGGCRNGYRAPAEIDIEILDLDAPVRRQHRLGAGPRGPTGTEARRSAIGAKRCVGNAAPRNI